MVNTSEVLLICYFMSTVELVKSRIQCVIEFNADFFILKMIVTLVLIGT